MISVVIRTKNEERWVGYAIQSIIENLENFEIIIVDNNSTDKTLEIVKFFKQDPLLNQNEKSNKYADISLLNIDEYTPGRSLNLGISKAKYEYIMIMSAHCVLKRFNQKELIKNLKSYAAVFGKQIPVWNGKKISPRYIWSHFAENIVENMFSKLENRYFFHNAISFFNRDIFKEHPFDDYLQSKEDRYWANEIVSSNKKYLYDPNIIVDHHYTAAGNTWKGIG